ncbi:MAG: thiamine pyrophosphate-dependent enzyme [Elusimicrobiota bacterium]
MVSLGENKLRKVFQRPVSLRSAYNSYCPGCGHGIVHRLIAEVIDELNIRESVIGVAPVGCAVFAYDYFNFDVTEAAHGRPPAVATGIKRVLPDRTVFTYQGDGDLAAIGLTETVHAALRGEKITIIFVNNAVYGMTGGQMAPTTLLGQKTTTTPRGRDEKTTGGPMKVCELLSSIDGAKYLERVSLTNPKNILQAKRAIKKAFLVQKKELGFSLVEVLSQCPVNWKLSPKESLAWVDQEMVKTFPLGVFKDVSWF